MARKLILQKQGDTALVKNPTPYYVTLINVAENTKALDSKDKKTFKPVMLAPFGESTLGVNANTLGQHPVMTYINDYGGRPTLTFQCQGNQCHVVPNDKPATP